MTDFARQTEQQRVLIVGLGVSGVSSLHYLARGNARLTVNDSRSVPTGLGALRAQYPDVEFRLGGFAATADRESVVEGKSVSVRLDCGGWRIIKKKKTTKNYKEKT